MNHDKTAHLAAFSKAFNGNDVASTEALMTADFVRIFYEGPDNLDGRILRGATAACAAVVERSELLKVPIHFTESQQYQYNNRTFTTYRAQGEFHTTGPLMCGRLISIPFRAANWRPRIPIGRRSLREDCRRSSCDILQPWCGSPCRGLQ
ncbi:MAG: hypothetical protein VCB63_01885 [Alphaproteobacteria bacterium]